MKIPVCIDMTPHSLATIQRVASAYPKSKFEDIVNQAIMVRYHDNGFNTHFVPLVLSKKQREMLLEVSKDFGKGFITTIVALIEEEYLALTESKIE
jgi:hypothetical protein